MRTLRLPRHLLATAMGVTMLAPAACHSDVETSDASADAEPMDAVADGDSGSDSCPQPGGCAVGRDGAVCPHEACSPEECSVEAGCIFI